MRERAARAFTVEQADQIMRGHLSEDMPDNIEEIEQAIGEAMLSGAFKITDKDSDQKILSIISQKDLMPPDWLAEDLLNRVYLRMITEDASFFSSFDNFHQEHKERYERLKDRESVKRVIATGGLCQDSFLVIKTIDEIDKALAQGQSYDEIFQSIIYVDCLDTNHAFLNHVEEKSKTEIKSRKQLYKIAELKAYTYEQYLKDYTEEDEEKPTSRQEFNEIQERNDPYLMALVDRYRLTLNKVLLSGGKYKDLSAIEPKSFGLPKDWRYPYDLSSMNRDKKWTNDTSKEGMILMAINHYFGLGDDFKRYSISLRDLAEKIEAPYKVILKALWVYN